MGVYDKADDLDPGSARERLANLPAGYYPRLKVIKCEGWQDQTSTKNHYYKIEVEVVDPGATGAEVGRRGSLFCQIAGNSHDYDISELAAVKLAIGCIFGYRSMDEIKAKIKGSTLEGARAGDGISLAGKEFAAKIWIKPNKKDPTAEGYQKFAAEPVGGFAKDGAAPGSAPPPPADGPPPPPSESKIPAGWKVHPSDSKWIYEVADKKNMRKNPDLS
jgi:hypothetical protein